MRPFYGKQIAESVAVLVVGMVMGERRVWEELSVFESHDFVETWYSRRHKRSLNASRIREIASAFSQGREYFASARGASSTVRPLLLYYGVLSLSRGAILLRDPHKSEASLKPSHGVEVVDWNQTLSSGIRNVAEVKVRATNGTFRELAVGVGNVQEAAYWIAPALKVGNYRADLGLPNLLEDGLLITLDDLLSRDHRFLATYERTMGKPTRVHLCEIVSENQHVEMGIFAVTPAVQAAVSEGRFGNGNYLGITPAARRLPLPNHHFRYTADDAKILLPANQYTSNDGMFVLENFSNGDRLSELLRTFMLSYSLGMLVRYFPSKWLALLRNEKGDVAQPLLSAAVSAVERDFPLLIVSAMA